MSMSETWTANWAGTTPDFNPFEERAPIEFERPLPKWWQRFTIQAVQPSVLVVDLSHYNAEGRCDFAKIKASGVAGVILKVSESDWYPSVRPDPFFEYSWQAALDNDLAVMLYHFFRGNKAGDVQFNWFMQCAASFLNEVGTGTAVALDVETVDGVDKDTRASRAFDFCRRIKEAGLKDGIYCSPGLVPTLFPLNDTRWNNLAWQWVAHWTSASDYTLPNGWSRSLVKAWQFGIYPTYAWCPKVEGAGNAVDINYMFFANEDELKDWLGQNETPPPQAEYPFSVQVNQKLGTIVRAEPGAGKYMGTERYLKGLTVFNAEADDDDDLWYLDNEQGDEWVRAGHVEKVE